MDIGKIRIYKRTLNKSIGFSGIMLMSSLLFYLFFACFDGAVICVDSPGYLEMNLTREPLYPMFLMLCRFLFGSVSADGYLFFAVLMQSILAAVAAWSLAAFLYREFHLSKAVSFLILLISPAVSLLCRFAARRGSMYSNSILTEGLTISCYLLFFRFLLAYVFKHTKRDLLICAALTFLMISTRKQMLFSLILLVFCISHIQCCTTQEYPQTAEHNGSDSRFLTTMAFYTAGRDDSRYIEDKEIQELFLKIYDICEENGYLKACVKGGGVDEPRLSLWRSL